MQYQLNYSDKKLLFHLSMKRCFYDLTLNFALLYSRYIAALYIFECIANKVIFKHPVKYCVKH